MVLSVSRIFSNASFRSKLKPSLCSLRSASRHSRATDGPASRHAPKDQRGVERHTWTRFFLISLTYTVPVFCALHVFTTHFFSITLAEGISMLPTVNSWGDWLIISKHYRRGRDIQVDDVVSIDHPVDEGVCACKRVVGMPGDFVCRDTPGVGQMMVQVPKGHCWLAGDNLKHSRDSRLYGPVPLALVKGKVIGRIPSHPKFHYPLFPPRPIAPAFCPAADDEDED